MKKLIIQGDPFMSMSYMVVNENGKEEFFFSVPDYSVYSNSDNCVESVLNLLDRFPDIGTVDFIGPQTYFAPIMEKVRSDVLANYSNREEIIFNLQLPRY